MRTVLFAEVPGFYAAVERAEDPALAKRPVIVGGDPRKRGRVQAATSDALAAGVVLDMTVLEALQVCPQGRAVRTNMRRYREVSRRLMTTLRGVHPQLETFGIGGAYGDLSSAVHPAREIADLMCEQVTEALGLPLRVGLASGKFLARLAAEIGSASVHEVLPGREHEFLAPLDVTRLDGVGRKTAATLAELGARTIGEVVALGRDRLEEVFGTHGLRIHAFATGRDDEPVRAERHPQSVSRESTVRGEPLDLTVLSEQLSGLAQELEEELQRQGLATGKVTLKVRYGDDQATASRTRTLAEPTRRAADLLDAAVHLLGRTQAGARPVRGLGLQLAALAPAGEGDRQLDLFRAQH